MTEPSQWAILTACSKNSFVMVLLILHVCFRLCVSFSKCLCGLHLRMYVYGCVCAHVCMSLQRHIHGIMSCRAGRCQGIWLRRNCSAVVISVFLAGIMLKTKNDWNDSDLPAWSAGLPLTTAWKYRLQQHSEKCYGFTLLWPRIWAGEAMKKGLTQSPALSSKLSYPQRN